MTMGFPPWRRAAMQAQAVGRVGDSRLDIDQHGKRARHRVQPTTLTTTNWPRSIKTVARAQQSVGDMPWPDLGQSGW